MNVTLQRLVVKNALAVVAIFFANAVDTYAQIGNFVSTDAEFISVAEEARARSARFWSGNDLPGRWSQPCPIQIDPLPRGGSGSTRFRIEQGEVFDWKMSVAGRRAEILHDVIPHEVDHMVRVSLVRSPIERWLDEGCASLMESQASHFELRRRAMSLPAAFLTPHWLEQADYPFRREEIDVIYVAGFSLVEYLLVKASPAKLLAMQQAKGTFRARLQYHYGETPEQLLQGWHHWRSSRNACHCAAAGCQIHFPPVNLPGNSSEFHTDQSIPDELNPGNTAPAGIAITAPRERPTLTIWTADWCGPCQQFQRDFQTNGTFRRSMEEAFVLQWKSVPLDSVPQAAGVSKVPTFQIGDSRIEGYRGPEDLLMRLKNAYPPGESISPAEHSTDGRSSHNSPRPPSVPRTDQILEPASSGRGSDSQLQIEENGERPVGPTSEAGDRQTTAKHRQENLTERVVDAIPLALTALQWTGIIGGSAATGGLLGLSISLLSGVTRKHSGSRRTDSKFGAAFDAGGEADRPVPFPRELEEARELLALRQSEGRVAVLDALRGLFLDDELEKLEQTPESPQAQFAESLRKAIDLRVSEVAPLTVDV